MAEGSSLDRTEAMLQRMERTLQTLPGGAIQAMLTSVGVTFEVKVQVKLQEELPQAQGLAVLEEILVPNNMRGMTQLKGLVAFQRHEGVPQIEHFNFRRSITVTDDVDDHQITGFRANRILEKAFTELRQHYPGYDLSFGGEEEQTRKSFQTFLRSFGVTLLLDFLILVVLFNSYIQPFLVLGLTIPTGLLGRPMP
jgi:multidrug efflux pump subunit AcrB